MDEKMEIRLVNPTEDGFLQRIDWNKAELEENVRSIVAAYQGFISCKSCGVPPDRCKGFCIFQRMTAEAEKQKQEGKSNGKI